MTKQTWLIIGATSAIARAFARLVASQGSDVILAGRDQEELERSRADLNTRYQIHAQVLILDVQKTTEHAAFIAQCKHLNSGVLNIFIAAGSMQPQANIEQNPDFVSDMIASNFTGIAQLLTGFIPVFEQQQAGHIIVLGSVAGDRGRPSNYVYGAAKAGLYVYLQGLRARLAGFKVKVTTIKPGFIDTSMTFGLPGLFLVASPEACAKASLQQARKNRASAYFPWFWRYIMLIICSIPDKVFNKLKL